MRAYIHLSFLYIVIDIIIENKIYNFKLRIIYPSAHLFPNFKLNFKLIISKIKSKNGYAKKGKCK